MATLGKTSKKRKHVKKSKTQTTSKKKPKPTKPLDSDDSDDDEPERLSDSDTDSDSGSDSDSNSDAEPEESLSSLLEPYTKSQLIDLVCDAAARDSSLLRRIRELADRDVSHRKIFVHGLAWDATRETLASAFGRFGEIEDCNVVLDKATGKAKGYGFVLYKTRKGAAKALKSPQKRINNRVATCQLASLGPPSSACAAAAAASSSGRKIYVGNVPADTDVVRFRDFFAKFGEIEAGPIGFDVRTGKSRGFALFVYKTAEGFERALREPHKVFEGHQLHCQKAAESKPKPKPATAPAPAAPQGQAAQPQGPPPMPMAVPVPMPPHNLAFLNPMVYGSGGGFVPGSINPMGVVPGGQFGGYTAAGGSVANGLQQVYPSVAPYGGGSAGTGGYPSSYMW